MFGIFSHDGFRLVSQLSWVCKMREQKKSSFRACHTQAWFWLKKIDLHYAYTFSQHTIHRELQLTWNTKFQFCWKWMIYGLIRSYLSNLSKKTQSKNVWPLVKNFFLPLWFSFLLSNLILERPFLHFFNI